MAIHIGVCSWSLGVASPNDLEASLARLRIDACQLALVPCVLEASVWGGAPATLKAGGIEVVSGMLAMIGEDYSTLDSIRETGGVASDTHWEANLALAKQVAAYAADRGISLVTFHAGFLPERSGDRRKAMLDRIREIASVFDDRSIKLGLETGQESAQTLLQVLDELECPNVGINFDPANMILYGMGDPVEALGMLSRRVWQIHIKDALPTEAPGSWGSEVAAGTGAVDWEAFFDIALVLPTEVDFIIEREAGAAREKDIAAARDLVIRYVAGG